MDGPQQLPRFQKAVKQLANGNTGAHITTVYRYASGKLPKAVRWLMQYPDLLRALADDVQAAQICQKEQETKS